MALNGYRSREDRATRLVETTQGLVALFQKKPQDYEVYRAGVKLGCVTRYMNWFAYPLKGAERGPTKTRNEAIELLLTPNAEQSPIDYAFRCYSCQREWEDRMIDAVCPTCGTTNRYSCANPTTPNIK